MRILHLKLRNLATYREVDLTPPDGLSVVIGPNGSGKSTAWAEGVTWCLYGDTVRGAPPVVEGQECYSYLRAEVGGREYSIVRTRKGKTTTLEFTACDDDGSSKNLTAQTVTDTQRRIDAIFGPFERHVSSRVFSREHVLRFGAATDKGRKQLVEGMLGLEQFDRGLALARNDSRAIQKDLTVMESGLNRADGHREACARRLAELSEPGRAPAAPGDLADQIDAAAVRLAATRAAEAQAIRALQAGDRLAAEAKANKAAAERRATEHKARAQRASAQVAAAGDPCPACGRDLDPSSVAEVVRHCGAQASEEDRLYQEALAEAEQAGAEVLDLLGEVNVLSQARIAARQAVADLEREGAELERLQMASQRHARDLDEATAALMRANQAHWEREGAVRTMSARLDTASGAEEALGLRGARTLMMDRGLARMQDGANQVLADIGVPLQVRVSGRTTQASGKEVDAVSVQLVGAGGGEYRGASAGERALVDLALLMGVSDLHGSPGLVVFDEVFDALDDANVERVSAYLAQLSRDRQVVVISHHEALRALLPGARVYRVSRDPDGKSVIS